MRTAALLLLIVVTGCEVRTAEPDRAGAALLFAQAALVDTDSTPAPTPDNGECSNCNGVGWTGDGRTWKKCLQCNEDEHIPRPGAIAPVAPLPAVIPVAEPPVWHDSLTDALLDHHNNGGMLAVIIGGDNCEPCQKRLAEAKALESSPYSWVYCKQDDPALLWMEITEVPQVPMFVLVIGDTVTPHVKPQALGLKAKL